MKVLLSWLRELADLPMASGVLAEGLTHAGLEVEERLDFDTLWNGLVLGEIRSLEKHPKADRLNVCQVFDGTDVRQVVCGAPNVRAGAFAPLARPGTVMPSGLKIESTQLRGVQSDGMLCSDAELGLAEKSAGLLLFDEGVAGTPMTRVLGFEGDAVLTLGVTPNRPDWLSHAGVAREAAAIFSRRFGQQPRPLRESPTRTGDRTSVTIEDADRCPRYAARVIEGVKVGPSPAWLRRRLERCGLRAINNVVDATNYVLLKLGHPLHAFDLDKLAEQRIVVRTARDGEKLKTLDGQERSLTTDDLVIADAFRPQALAGVMGGGESEVSEGTTRLLLESAYFEPRGIRITARRHGLHTEASHRFERGADPEAVRGAVDAVAGLILDLAGGDLLGAPVDVYPGRAPRPVVAVEWTKISELLGVVVPRDEAISLLARLEIPLESATDTVGRFTQPSHRPDLLRDVDLIEEVARLRGYRTIPAALPAIRLQSVPAQRSPLALAGEAATSALCAAGLSEAINFGFVAPEQIAAMRFGADDRRSRPLPLRNPIAADLSVMRTSLLPHLLRNASHNLRHGVPAVHLFEVGRIFLPSGERLPEERLLASGIRAGQRQPLTSIDSANASTDFYDIKGAVEELLDALGLGRPSANRPAAELRPTAVPYLHPRASAGIYVGALGVGVCGEVQPEVAKAFDLDAATFVFELDLQALIDLAEGVGRFQELPRFPQTYRDMAIVVDTAVTWSGIREEVLAAGGTLCREVRIFDVYMGKPVPEDKKSVAFAITYQAPDRTLTDDEVGRVHDAIRRRLEERLGARIRE